MTRWLLAVALILVACRPSEEQVRAAARDCGSKEKPGSEAFYWCLDQAVGVADWDCEDWYGNQCVAWGREGSGGR